MRTNVVQYFSQMNAIPTPIPFFFFSKKKVASKVLGYQNVLNKKRKKYKQEGGQIPKPP